MQQGLGQLAERDLAAGHQDPAGQPGPGRVGRGAGAGVAGRGADHRGGPAARRALTAIVMPRSLNDPVGLAPSILR